MEGENYDDKRSFVIEKFMNKGSPLVRAFTLDSGTLVRSKYIGT